MIIIHDVAFAHTAVYSGAAQFGVDQHSGPECTPRDKARLSDWAESAMKPGGMTPRSVSSDVAYPPRLRDL